MQCILYPIQTSCKQHVGKTLRRLETHDQSGSTFLSEETAYLGLDKSFWVISFVNKKITLVRKNQTRYKCVFIVAIDAKLHFRTTKISCRSGCCNISKIREHPLTTLSEFIGCLTSPIANHWQVYYISLCSIIIIWLTLPSPFLVNWSWIPDDDMMVSFLSTVFI